MPTRSLAEEDTTRSFPSQTHDVELEAESTVSDQATPQSL